jgi:Ulp1 family protease
LAMENWLNDETMDAYIRLLDEIARSGKEIRYMTCQQLVCIMNNPGATTAGASRIQLVGADKRLLAVCLNQVDVHWSFAILDNVKNKVYYGDSAQGATEIPLRFEATITRLARFCGLKEVYTTETLAIPKQKDSTSCGPRVLRAFTDILRQCLAHGNTDISNATLYQSQEGKEIEAYRVDFMRRVLQKSVDE